jgi:salicylate---CoA ligase
VSRPAADHPVSPISAGTVPWPEDLARAYTAAGWWRGQSLGAEILAVAETRGTATALVDGTTRLSYASVAARADALASRLTDELGLRRGDRIVVQLPNCWEFVVLTLACLRAGIVPVMALPAHRQHELAYLCEHSEARALAVPGVLRDFDHQEMAARLRAGSPALRHVLVAGDAVRPGHADLAALCAEPPTPEPAGPQPAGPQPAGPQPGHPQPAGPEPPTSQPGRPQPPAAAHRARWDAHPPDARDVAVFLLSGGTTGLPKLIARTHNDYAYNARASAELCGLGPGSVYLVSLPASHNFPLACPGLLGTLLAGGRVVMAPSPQPQAVFPLIAAEAVTITAVVPAVAQRWLAYAQDHGRTDRLRILQVGGARIADELARKVRPVLGATLQQVFGMAEGLLNYTRLDDPDDVICGTQGRPLSPGDEVRIVGPAGEDLPDGAPGALLTRGPYTPRGYYRAAEQNTRAFTPDGWYASGDIVRRRPDGNLVVEGRDKDMINRGGEKVSAEEVENLVYRLPGIAQVAAVAAPDPGLGERVCVFVVPGPGADITLAAIRDSMAAAGVARFKWPERLELVPELPVTKVGKLDKKALREILAAPGGA